MLRSAPVEWLLELHTDLTLYLLYTVLVISGCFLLINLWEGRLQERFSPNTLPAYSVYWLSLLVGVRLKSSLSKLPARLQEMCVVAIFNGIAGCGSYLLLFVEDKAFRERSIIAQMLFVRQVPAILGFRPFPTIVFLVLQTGVDVHMHMLMNALHGYEVTVRVYVNILVYGVLYFILTYIQQLRLKLLYDTQIQLKTEKDASQALMDTLRTEYEASQSLVSMICDAAFWVAADGDTVLQSEQRFDQFMGESMAGKALSDYVPSAEQARLRIVFGSEATALKAPVTLLTTSLWHSSGSLSNVDLFVVDRRLAFTRGEPWQATAMASRQMGFLVGLRFCYSPEMFFKAVEPSPAMPLTCPTEAANKSFVVYSQAGVPTLHDDSGLRICRAQELRPGTRLLCLDTRTQTVGVGLVAEVGLASQQMFCEVVFGDEQIRTSPTVCSMAAAQVDSRNCRVSMLLPQQFQMFVARVNSKPKWLSMHRLREESTKTALAQCFQQERPGLAQIQERYRAFDLKESERIADGVAIKLAEPEHQAIVICLSESHCDVDADGVSGTMVAMARPRSVQFDCISSSCSFKSSDSGIIRRSATAKVSKSSAQNVARFPIGPPFGPPFQPADAYLMDWSMSIIYDLMDSWNFEGSGCCLWHANLQRLSSLLQDVGQRHKCSDNWKPEEVDAQCQNCLALLHVERDSSPQCWICSACVDGPEPSCDKSDECHAGRRDQSPMRRRYPDDSHCPLLAESD